MPKFVTIGYGDEGGYNAADPTAIAEAHKNDERLVSSGDIVGIANEPVQVRNPDGVGVHVTKGQYLSSRLPLAGFAVIEAMDLEDAIAKVAKSPCAVAQGVVEVWPLG